MSKHFHGGLNEIMRNLKTDGDQAEIRSSKLPSEIQMRYHLY